jgi:hypothetical protein
MRWFFEAIEKGAEVFERIKRKNSAGLHQVAMMN